MMVKVNDSKKLLLRASLKPDESLMGFIVRLTELNGYNTPAWIIREAGIEFSKEKCAIISHKSFDLSALSTLTGANLADLESLRYPVDPQSGSNFRRLLNGLTVPQYVIRPNHPKVCPRCLFETAYIRKIWEFTLVTACPIHQCLLLDTCPNCDDRITWTRREVAVCRCGYDWRKYNSNTIDNSELQMAQQIYVLCRLYFENLITKKNTTESNPLYRVDLQYLVAAVLFIASQFAYKKHTKGARKIDTTGKNFARTNSNAEIHALLCKAWSVFDGWPENYMQFLEWRRLHIPNSHFKSGLYRDFAEYKSALYCQLSSKQLDFMRAAFEEFLVTRWDGGYAAHLRRITCNQRATSRYVSRRVAKKFLHISVQAIDRLIMLGKLKAVVNLKRDPRAILIERASLQSVKQELGHRLFLKQVAAKLGVTPQRVYELIKFGLLSPIKGEIYGRRKRMFLPEDVEHLLITIRGKLAKKPITGSAKISFFKALKELFRVNIGIGQFIQIILEGKILPLELSTKPGLASLIFSKSSIEEYIKESERIILGDTISVPEVAKVLRVGVTQTRFLITKGIIRVHRKVIKGRYDLRINKSEIDQFNSAYILAAKLAKQFNTTSARLTNLLINWGVNPISGAKVDGGKQYIFRRTDIEQIDLAAIWQAAKSEHISRLNENKLIDVRRAAEILQIGQKDVVDLAKRGILTLHRDVPLSSHKAYGPFFAEFTIKKYKAGTTDYSGLVSFTVAAEMLGISVSTLYTYLPKNLLKVALEERIGRRYFSLDDVERLIEDRDNLKLHCVTTKEVASICKVSKESVYAWVEAGLLRPASGPGAVSLVQNLYRRSDAEKLYAEREAFKARRVSEGRSARFGRPAGPNWQPVKNKVGPRIEQLVKKWSDKPNGKPISGQRLRRQLVKEGYRVGINTIYVCLRELRQQADAH